MAALVRRWSTALAVVLAALLLAPSASAVVLRGGAGPDALSGTPGDDRLSGLGGADRLAGLGGGDRLDGGRGDDALDGGPGADRLDGGAGHDALVGGPGADVLTGGAGDDRVDAADGERDSVECGAGADRVTADPADRASRDCEAVERVAPGVPAARLARLTRGDNLSWLHDGGRARGASDAAMLALRAAGFRHVRLQVRVPWFAPGGAVDATARATVRDVVRRAVGHGLAVVLSPHDQPQSVWDDPAALAAVDAALAATVADTSPEWVFLEVANEPYYPDARTWNPIQARALAAMRAQLPGHTLIAVTNLRSTTGEWDSIAAATAVEVVPDRNVVYSVHYYEPMAFSHQGSDWAWRPLQHLRDLPYPSDPAAVGQASVVDPTPASTSPAEAADMASARWALADYGEQRWGPARVAARIAVAADWAAAAGVPLYVGEFGAYPYTTRDHASRLRWLTDVRQALEARGSGWAVWDDGWLRAGTAYRAGELTALGLPEPPP